MSVACDDCQVRICSATIPTTLDPDYILPQPNGPLGFRIHDTSTQRSKYVPRPLPCYIRVLMSALQELAADVARIELTRRNAAVLEAKAVEERARLFALRAAQATDSPETPAIGEPTEERVDPATVSSQELRETFAKDQTKRLHKDSSPWKPDRDEAEAWTPRAVRRRG